MKLNSFILDFFLFFNYELRLIVDFFDKIDNFCRKCCICYFIIIKICCNNGGGDMFLFYVEIFYFF